MAPLFFISTCFNFTNLLTQSKTLKTDFCNILIISLVIGQREKKDIWISIFFTSPRQHAVGICNRQCSPPKPKIICPQIFDLGWGWGRKEIIENYTTHFLISIIKTYRQTFPLVFCIFILGCLHKHIKWAVILFVLFVCCCCCCCCCVLGVGLFVVVVCGRVAWFPINNVFLFVNVFFRKLWHKIIRKHFLTCIPADIDCFKLNVTSQTNHRSSVIGLKTPKRQRT